ncbi:response regulator [Candidatus Nitrosocosmicus hydrocola]|uniref:response regulator n=1 Tax=Candidatus Nitrosocosmicus hydrocola TaxID=1826872 RepID=UPI0011E5F067|nr:response regulator [Candidatus Nitrosocosmicus hydrocola]
MFNIQNITAGILDSTLLHYETRHNENVPSYVQTERNIGTAHSDTDLQIYADNENKEFVNKKGHTHLIKQRKQARFLIAESEKELRYLFEAYLDLLRVDSDIVDSGNRALSTFVQSKNKGKEYDAVILDTHLRGKRGLDVAKEIHKKDNSQRIILVTTDMKERLPRDELQAAAICDKDILVMPFELSSLSKLLINDSAFPRSNE